MSIIIFIKMMKISNNENFEFNKIKNIRRVKILFKKTRLSNKLERS